MKEKETNILYFKGKKSHFNFSTTSLCFGVVSLYLVNWKLFVAKGPENKKKNAIEVSSFLLSEFCFKIFGFSSSVKSDKSAPKISRVAQTI